MNFHERTLKMKKNGTVAPNGTMLSKSYSKLRDLGHL